MWGNPGHLAELKRIITETYASSSDDTQLEVLVAETNSENSTYDGIDWGGERVAQEVTDKVVKLEQDGKTVTRFSVTGYSLGGLIARYLVGILYQRSFFMKVVPTNFNTLATPHIGLPRYPSFFSAVTSSLGPKLLSRTGEQFYLVDKWSASGRPLIEVLADPDRIFHQALQSFQHIRIYANAIHDITVPYVTSAIEVEDPFALHETNGIEIQFEDNYPCLIKSFEFPVIPSAPTPKPIMLSPEWWRALKPRRPFLPPPLQMRFPFNLVIYTMLPLLLPVFISLIVVHLSLATKASRARIRLLEEDRTNTQRLIDILAELEDKVELVDASPSREEKGKQVAALPILTPVQVRAAEWLNQLPLQKQLAYFPDVRNAHAIIVCRDAKRFEVHRQGEGILRHWATSFVL
ncbi:putative lipase [Termitomyces sp. T112]|nr:putative lipase [Termitomyces sp. T112]KNZ76139.1 Putative lipase [Termitomyces sp. J132]